MLDTTEVKYSYRDVAVVPAQISSISSRSECNPFDKNGYFPLFTAPMTSVVDLASVDKFEENKIYSILPRSVAFAERFEYAKRTKRWIAVSLREFDEHFLSNGSSDNVGLKILIDIANGHMQELYEMVKKAKSLYGDTIKIMIGNIANPETYKAAVHAGADYCRVSVGTGCGCITSSNTAIHFPIASLIDEMYKIKQSFIKEQGKSEESLPKIVADGGIRNYSDIIKALSLGADYVMIGSVFAQSLESAGIIRNFATSGNSEFLDKNDIIYTSGRFYHKGNQVHPMKLFYGMASKHGQMDLNGSANKTAEGIEKWIQIKYTLSGWVDNFSAYLRSAMSYTDNRTIDGMKNNRVIIVSQGTIAAVNE